MSSIRKTRFCVWDFRLLIFKVFRYSHAVTARRPAWRDQRTAGAAASPDGAALPRAGRPAGRNPQGWGEAAHIKMHSAGGPDEVPNGLSLCVIHHKLFDLGALTVDCDLNIRVSERVVGDWGRRLNDEFHEKPIMPPRIDKQAPAAPYLQWHISMWTTFDRAAAQAAPPLAVLWMAHAPRTSGRNSHPVQDRPAGKRPLGERKAYPSSRPCCRQ